MGKVSCTLMRLMTMFYKVIYIGNMESHSFFCDTFGVRGLADLTRGRMFHADASRVQSQMPEYVIQSPVPLIHFCDNALDTLLWCKLFGHVRYVFKIKPIGDVQRAVCNDNIGLYQCGAPGIELKRRISEEKLIKLARREVSRDIDAAVARYAAPSLQNYIRRLLCDER